MSETKFTPGPWTVLYETTFRSFPNDVVQTAVCGQVKLKKEDKTEGLIFARLMANQSSTTAYFDICPEANAHLISAAPDLYAALNSLLKTVVDDLGECGYSEDDIADHDGVKRAQAALAKARGETP